MEKNSLKKSGVVFMVITAIMFGLIIGIQSTNSLLVIVTTLVVIMACIILGHFLITKKLNQEKRIPIELIIILFADIVFGLFAGSILGVINPTYQLLSAGLIAICGFIAFFVMYLKSPAPDAIKST